MTLALIRVSCPPCCTPTHTSPCNPDGGLPTVLHVSLNHAGVTITFDITWDATQNCPGSTEGWGYNHLEEESFDIEVCPGFYFRALTLCCQPSIPRWDIELVMVFGTIQQDFQSNPFTRPVITVTQDPMHLTWESEVVQSHCPGGDETGSDSIRIDIQA